MFNLWLPLESNPDVMTKYIKSLGVMSDNIYFDDVLGLDDELLSLIPGKVLAILFVFPVCSATEAASQALREAQVDELSNFKALNNVFYTDQLVGNACGTIGVLHALMNNYNELGQIGDESFLCNLKHNINAVQNNSDGALLSTVDTAPDSLSIANFIAQSPLLQSAHESCASDGVTHATSDPVDLHFVCYTYCGGRCVELDGRQGGPILHGVCDSGLPFLRVAASAIQEKMRLCGDRMDFSMTALCKSS